MQAITGIGLRQPHVGASMATRQALPFVEVHSENFFGNGGAVLQLLRDVRAGWAISLHRAGLSLDPRPTLVEWDSALPSLEALLDEARQADWFALR